MVGSLMAFAAAAAAQRWRSAPGCKRPSALAALERSLKAERKVPYDPAANPLRTCDKLQPIVTREMRRASQPAVAVIGIRRVGVTMTFVAEFEGRGQSCDRVKAPVTPNLELRVCATL
jgi:hypothetical protein